MSEQNSELLQKAAMFKALGDPTRLRIFEFLCNCCDTVAVNSLTIEKNGDVHALRGSTVGEICCSLTGDEKITSTMSHHLKELRLAGLITMERSGKNMLCRVNEGAFGDLMAYLGSHEDSMKNGACCADPSPLLTVQARSPRS